MQAPGELVVLLPEFRAGMQPGQDDLDPGHLLLGVLVHGHPAAVVDDLDGAVLEMGDLDAGREAGNGLVHGIVDDLLGQVVRPGGVGVHAGSPLDRIETPQHLEVGGIVMIRTVFHFLTCLINILRYQTHWKLLIVLHFIRNEIRMPAGLHPVSHGRDNPAQS